MEYRRLKEYIGHRAQLFEVRESRLSGGRADGTRIVDIFNGGNLSVTIVPDACMDILSVRYKGRCLNYISPSGQAHPAYYNPFGEGWSEVFPAGFLFTCGLSHIGIKDDDWEGMKEHGAIGNRPAEHLNITEYETEDGRPGVLLEGTMRESMLAGRNLSLRRRIRMEYAKDVIEIEDTVKNEGFRAVPHMILYHCNMGWPLLSPESCVKIPNKGIRPRTEFAEKMRDAFSKIPEPFDALEEMCYYYDTIEDEDGMVTVEMRNPQEGAGIKLRYGKKTLPQFVQWKNFVKGEYIMGLEPGNATIDGKADAENRGALPMIGPQEEISYHLCFSFNDGQEEG